MKALLLRCCCWGMYIYYLCEFVSRVKFQERERKKWVNIILKEK